MTVYPQIRLKKLKLSVHKRLKLLKEGRIAEFLLLSCGDCVMKILKDYRKVPIVATPRKLGSPKVTSKVSDF